MTTQPTNAKTGKAYTGGNTTILLQNDYTDQVWATYRQWQDLGYQVQKGQKGERAKAVDLEDMNFKNRPLRALKAHFGSPIRLQGHDLQVLRFH